jgi:cell wall-associated NlpC family hydrolase
MNTGCRRSRSPCSTACASASRRWKRLCYHSGVFEAFRAPLSGEGETILKPNKRLVAALLAVVVFVFAAAPAWASPINDKRARAIQVKAQVDALDAKAELATEDYDAAASAYHDLNVKVANIEARISHIKAQTGVLQTSLDSRADVMYRSGPLGVLDVLLGTTTFDDFAATWDLLNDMNKTEARTVATLKSLRAEADAARADLKVAQSAAKSSYDTMSARRSSILGDLAARKSMLHGLESEIASLEAADQARRAAAERSYGGSGGGTGWDWGNPTNAPRTAVVDIAKKYIGCPYVWGASGPRTFDCSGFTMFVYAQVGVHLPHHAASQFSCGQRVSRANLQPGDLVFFGSPIHHVGIYVGGGDMIDAPCTGDVVSINPLYSDYAGACRP